MSGETSQGARVLIVEDEPLVAMLLEDILTDAGCVVAGAAAGVAEALRLIAEEDTAFDLAILDVNLGGHPIFPVAEALAARGRPFVFSTGYGAAGLPDAWRDRPTLQKPFTNAEVEQALASALGAIRPPPDRQEADRADAD